MIHKMNLAAEPFEQIASGRKTIEMRLLDEKRQKLMIGDLIEFTNLSDNKLLLAEVVALHIFDSFADLYSNLPLLKCGYTEDTIQEAKPDDMLQYYSQDKQDQYKALGIEIKLV